MLRAAPMMNGEIALVTGASRGIGAAIAARLASDGARVIGTATTAEGAQRISESLAAQGGRGAVLDVASQDSIDALLEDIESREGPVEILCNNAGITRDTLLLRMKQEDWDAVMQTNLASVFRLSKAVLRGMMKSAQRTHHQHCVGGRFDRKSRVRPTTAAAKAGIIGFTKSLAREVGSRGITVNVIAPGFIDTDMTRALNDAQRASAECPDSPGQIGAAGGHRGRGGLPRIRRTAAYITGETLHVNGGMYMA